MRFVEGACLGARSEHERIVESASLLLRLGRSERPRGPPGCRLRAVPCAPVGVDGRIGRLREGPVNFTPLARTRRPIHRGANQRMLERDTSVESKQAVVASTRAIIRHLEERFGGQMPSANELLAADPPVLREAGFSARKGRTLRALAERFVDGRLSDEALGAMTDEEVVAALTEVSGIGRWTARGFLLVALDRPDVFLSGDLALRRAIQRAYGFDHLPTEDEVAEVSDRWRPYRSLAVSYLFASEYREGVPAQDGGVR